MGDLAGILPIGGGGATVRPQIEATTQAVPAVQSSVAGQSLAGQNGSGGSQSKGQKGFGSDDAPAYQRKSPVDPNAHAGPTPAFQVSVLEMDKDLQQALARLEAERSKPSNDAAIAPIAKPDTADDVETEKAAEPAVKGTRGRDSTDPSGAEVNRDVSEPEADPEPAV